MRQERKGSVILPSLVKPCLLPLNVLRSWWDVWNSGRISRPWETALEKEAIMQMLHLPHKDDRYALKCFPAGTSGKEPTCQCRRPGFNPWGEKIPWKRIWQPTLAFLSEKSHGQRSLDGLQSMGSQESDTTERLNHHCGYVGRGYINLGFRLYNLYFDTVGTR